MLLMKAAATEKHNLSWRSWMASLQVATTNTQSNEYKAGSLLSLNISLQLSGHFYIDKKVFSVIQNQGLYT